MCFKSHYRLSGPCIQVNLPDHGRGATTKHKCCECPQSNFLHCYYLKRRRNRVPTIPRHHAALFAATVHAQSGGGAATLSIRFFRGVTFIDRFYRGNELKKPIL